MRVSSMKRRFSSVLFSCQVIKIHLAYRLPFSLIIRDFPYYHLMQGSGSGTRTLDLRNNLCCVTSLVSGCSAQRGRFLPPHSTLILIAEVITRDGKYKVCYRFCCDARFSSLARIHTTCLELLFAKCKLEIVPMAKAKPSNITRVGRKIISHKLFAENYEGNPDCLCVYTPFRLFRRLSLIPWAQDPSFTEE